MDMAAQAGFLERLKQAGITPEDNERERLNKTLLVFATGLISLTSVVWLLLYSALGSDLSSTLPFVYQLLLTGNLINYIRGGNFRVFRVTQLGLFLFAPFVMQWAIGNFINSSGVILWGLIAPFGAMLCLGIRESLSWFLAWVALTLLSGVGDFIPLLEDGTHLSIPVKTSMSFFALNFVAVATIIFVLLRYSIVEKEKISARLEIAHLDLVREQLRSEKLLLNILPPPVAARLKDEDEVIADGFEQVAVMFVDIVNFTRVAIDMPPAKVFTMLNTVFSAFDELTDAHGVEKIKTIGDAYMVAGGVNIATPRPMHATAALALEMQALMHSDKLDGASGLQLHIGICTGPVIGGVLGKNKFVYDLWGDTVNVASRITDEAEGGQILCDARTYALLADEFEFSSPAMVDLRGRGRTEVYELLARKVAQPPAITQPEGAPA